MKKITLGILLIGITFFLSACTQMITIDLKVKKLKDNVEEGMTISDVQEAYLTNPKFPDVVVFFDTNEHTIVQVHHYNTKTKKWSLVYEDRLHDNYGGLESLTFLKKTTAANSELEHVYIGYQGGNGGFLNFYILGKDNKGDIKEVFNKMMNEFPNSHVEDTDIGFDLYSDGKIVESYLWDEDSYIIQERKKTAN